MNQASLSEPPLTHTNVFSSRPLKRQVSRYFQVLIFLVGLSLLFFSEDMQITQMFQPAFDSLSLHADLKTDLSDNPICPIVTPMNDRNEQGNNLSQENSSLAFPSFVIYNWGKSGSHFLTQTLTNIGIPVSFEYGLRLNKATEEKTNIAIKMYEQGDSYGFSGADFQYGNAQDALNGGPTNWTAILIGLSQRSSLAVKHVVLLRTNVVARAIGSPAGVTNVSQSVRHSAGELKRINLATLKDDEEHNMKLVKNACNSAYALSGRRAHIFIINYESLLIDPAKHFNELVLFLGGNVLTETDIIKAVENGKFKRKHSSMIYSDVGLQGISDNLFSNNKLNVSSAIKNCFQHQALASFPRLESMCFNECIIPSGRYLCEKL